MRKIISTFALVAIIASLLVGVLPAFAAVDTAIVLNQEVVNHAGVMTISGRIVRTDTYATAGGYTGDVSVAGYTLPAQNGNFTISFIAGIGRHAVTATASGDYNAPAAVYVRVVPRVILENPSSMQLTYPAPSQVEIKGTFPDGNGDDFDQFRLGYVKEDNTIDSQIGGPILKGANSFIFLANGTVFNQTGRIGLFAKLGANEVLVLEGRVSAQEFGASMMPVDVTRSLGNQPVTFTTNIGAQYLNGEFLKTNHFLKVSYHEADGTLKLADTILASDSKAFKPGQKSSMDLPCDVWEVGNYKARLTLWSGGVVVGEKTLDFRIIPPAPYTLMGWGLDTASVGDIKIKFPASDSGIYPGGVVDQQIQVKNNTGNDMRYFKVDIQGGGVDKTLSNYGPDVVPGNIATISLTQTGNMQFTIKVYAAATDANPVVTFNQTVSVTGFNVSINPKQVQADSTGDVVVTVTDESNRPINNAKLYFKVDGGVYTLIIDGTIVNIQNGQYIYRNDSKSFFKNVGNVHVQVTGFHNGKFLDIKLDNAIAVVGEQVYTVTSNKESLVNGFEDTFYITTKQGSEFVFPERFERINVDKDGKRSVPQVISGIGYKNMDGDGINEAMGIKLTPTNNQKYLIIRTSTDNGKKMGEVKLDVVGANVSSTAAQAATENIRSKFTFTATDPRDSKALTSPIYLTANKQYIDYSLRDRNGNNVGVYASGESMQMSPYNSTYEFYIYVDDVDWEKAELNKQEELFISVFAKSTGLEDIKLFDIPVGKATLKANPPELVIGSQSRNIEISYLSADEKPLKGYMVFVNDEEIGETDQNGKVFYVSVGSGAQINLKAKTDDTSTVNSTIVAPSANHKDTIFTEGRIRSVVDTVPPTASAPATVNESSVLITIEDNGLINRLMVNKKPVDIFFPQPKLTHIHTGLKKGVNTITVEAVDMAGNYGKTVLQVNYTDKPGTPPPPSGGGTVQFAINKQTEYGMPQLIDGTTMVPARFVEILGVSFEFDNKTKTATYKYGDNTISVTNNKATALVNGEPVLMTKPAYINEQGRFMVPLRMIGQELGFKVHWDNATKSGTITK